MRSNPLDCVALDSSVDATLDRIIERVIRFWEHLLTLDGEQSDRTVLAPDYAAS